MNGYSKIVIFSWFVLAQLANIFIPERPIWDEKLFWDEVLRYGDNYLPVINEIRDLQSPMGPVYFIIYGLIGKLTGFSLFWMRSIHLLFSLSLLFIVRDLLKNTKHRALLILVFILNPYFLVMTGPLLYTDVVGLLFAFSGVLFYIRNRFWFLSGILWGLAICTRQLYVIVPLAALLVEVYNFFVNGRFRYQALMAGLIPFVLYFPLFALWDFNLNSGAFPEGRFEENTMGAFSFTFRAFSYSMILTGLYAIAVLYRDFLKAIAKPYPLFLLLAIVLCLIDFPVSVNRGMTHGHLPDTAGALDIIFVNIWYFKYLLVPLLLYWSLLFYFATIKMLLKGLQLFYTCLLFLFVLLESVYAYCWDKHFILVIPIVFIISEEIKESGLKPSFLKAGRASSRANQQMGS